MLIGQPLIPVQGPNGEGFVCLTAKNMQCLQALIRLGKQANLFQSDAWLPILHGFAHGVWIMGLRANAELADGSLALSQVSNTVSSDPTLITTAAEKRLVIIANEIQKVFDTAATELEEVSLHHLVSALGQLSQTELECTLKQIKSSGVSEEKQHTIEPGLFALSQLVRLAYCCIKSKKAELVINPVTGHLLEACQNSHKPVRIFSAKALCNLVNLMFEYQSVTLSSMKPLLRISEVKYLDVKMIQVESLEKLIESNGNFFDDSQWIAVLEMIRSACFVEPDKKSSSEHAQTTEDILKQAMETTNKSEVSVPQQILSQSEETNNSSPTHNVPEPTLVLNNKQASLAKCAFRLLQKICDDYLEILGKTGEKTLFKLIRACGGIGQQQFDINTSLTAVGLLWNICDYLGSRENLDPDDPNKTVDIALSQILKETSLQKAQVMIDASATIPWYESLIGCLLTEKDVACLSASMLIQGAQTQYCWLAIFSELSLLCMNPVAAMRKSAVQSLFQTINAHVSQLNEITTDSLLYILVRLPRGCVPPRNVSPTQYNNTHHSRDTPEKQWAETRSAVLTGMAKTIAEARVIVDHRHWVACLSEISLATRTTLPEITNAALVGLKILLEKKNVQLVNDKRKKSSKEDLTQTGNNWRLAWNCWLEIGRSKTAPLPVNATDLISLGDLSDVQKLLVEHTSQAFTLIERMTGSGFDGVNKSGFQNEATCLEGLGVGDLKSLFEMLTRTLSLPVMSDWPPMAEQKYEEGWDPILDENQAARGLATVRPQLTALQMDLLYNQYF